MSDFDWNIYIKKAARKFIIAGIVSGLTALSAYLGTEPVPTQYVTLVMFVSAIIDLGLNAAKHTA